MGLEAEEAHDRLKRRGSLPNRTQKQKRRKPEERFEVQGSLVGAGGRVLCGRDRKNGAPAAVV